MYDASVKEPVGIEYGETYQFGSFDECLGAFHHHYQQDRSLGQVSAGFQDQLAAPEFSPQYCLADVHVRGYSIGALSSRDHQIKVKRHPKCKLPIFYAPLRTVHSPPKSDPEGQFCYRHVVTRNVSLGVISGEINLSF